MKSISKLCLGVLFLSFFGYSYLQMPIIRSELKSGLKGQEMKCITKFDDQQITKKEKQQSKKKSDDDDQSEQIDDEDIQESKNYEEICYEKDIAYVWQIVMNHQVYHMAMDTTLPVGWIKSSKCHIEGSTKKCSRISQNFKEQIKGKFTKKKTQNHHTKSDYAIIEGSSQLVKGIYQPSSNLAFHSRDTSRFANFLELMSMGFYLSEEKQTFTIDNTQLINATEISRNLNYLADGGISLRFDDKSENSFLNELFAYQNNIGKIATIWIKDGRGLLTIGDISTKHSLNGYGGIEWVSISQDQKYGKVPTITDVIIDSPDSKFISIHDKKYPAIISLSASYIGLPQKLMEQWKQKLSNKAGCQVNENTKYLQCSKIKEEDKNKILTFVIDEKRLSFKFGDLILGKQHSKTILNLKVTPYDKYAILGEPLFNQYLVVFDYDKNKVGFSQKRDELKQIINTISLVRFICFIFVIGCSFIVCFWPIKRCIQVMKEYFNKQRGTASETRRLKGYGAIQENAYEGLSGEIQDALQE